MEARPVPSGAGDDLGGGQEPPVLAMGWAGSVRLLNGIWPGRQSQYHREYRPTMHCAVHLNDAVVLFDNLLADPQPEPSPDCTFSREERLEDVLSHTCANAFAIVSYGHSDAAMISSYPQLDRAFLIDGVQAVDQEIGKDLPQLTGNRGDLYIPSHCFSIIACFALILLFSKSTVDSSTALTDVSAGAFDSR